MAKKIFSSHSLDVRVDILGGPYVAVKPGAGSCTIGNGPPMSGTYYIQKFEYSCR